MIEVVILAAGEGKRMNSALPKVLQPVGGRPMLLHLIETARQLHPERIHVVVGAGAERVRTALAGQDVCWAVQKQRLGTGHAAMQALPAVDPAARVLVLPGDMPLVRATTLSQLLESAADLAVLSFMADDPTGYGRILRDGEQVTGIREDKDASDAERAINEVNSGVLAAGATDLAAWLDRVGADNAQGEYYLTDCVGLAADDGRRVDAVVAEDAGELMGANDRVQMAALERVFQQRARRLLMEQGVAMADPDSVQVRGSIQAGRDVFIDVNVVLHGDVRLGDGVQVGAGSVLGDCELAAGTVVHPYCVLEGASTTGACTIGPFARLRPGTVLAEGVRIGNFVETKNARMSEGSKASHLAYVGDADVGAAANLGAGTITCNYDGVNKHRTIIGERAFIGSNSSLVAPVDIGAEATIGAGSVVSGTAPAGQLTLSRARQRTVAGWQRPRKKDQG
jgi:bifunctional UDP-N-acetylglucosamine pyrophosphorylase / glucosamine-1-phosphate N-acetyltransferase